MKGWSIHNKGYLIYTSRAKRISTTKGIKRGARAHRVVVEKVIGRRLLEDEIVHHMDLDKLNCCWCNLLITRNYFNPSTELRDPYTGAFMSPRAWEARYGVKKDDVPEWVK